MVSRYRRMVAKFFLVLDHVHIQQLSKSSVTLPLEESGSPLTRASWGRGVGGEGDERATTSFISD